MKRTPCYKRLFFNGKTAHARESSNASRLLYRSDTDSVGFNLGGVMWREEEGKRRCGEWILMSLGMKNTPRSSGYFWPCVIVVVVLLIIACGIAQAADMQNLTASYYSRASLIQEGTAKCNPSFTMANGRIFYDDAMVAACNSYKLGDRVMVTNIRNGKSVVLLVADRTAKRFKGKRIDLSAGAFRMLAPLSVGLIKVTVEKI